MTKSTCSLFNFAFDIIYGVGGGSIVSTSVHIIRTYISTYYLCTNLQESDLEL